MIKYFKEEIKHLPSMLVIAILFYVVGTFATSSYAIGARDIRYIDNNSNLASADVQNAVEELHFHATDYNNIDNRVDAIEEKIGNNTLSTTAQDLVGATNELMANKANLSGATFTGNLTIKQDSDLYLGLDLYNGNTKLVSLRGWKDSSDHNRMVIRAYKSGTSYYTNIYFPASTATTANVTKIIATTDDLDNSHTYKSGDTITLPRFMYGYGISTSAVKLYFPTPKAVPTASGYTFTVSIQTVNNLYYAGGTSISIANATFTAAAEEGGLGISVTCSGLSGIVVGARYRINISGTRTVTIGTTS